jgi:hypothetical protein
MPGLGNAPKPIRRRGCLPQFFSGDPTQQAIKATIIWGRRITRYYQRPAAVSMIYGTFSDLR